MQVRDIYRRNLGLKILALVLALALWFTAVGRERAEVGLNVPLEMVNFPQDMVVANQVPDGISVRIRGPVALTRQAASRQPRFSLDLSDAQKGANHFTLSPEALDLPRGLEVTRLAPSQVTVELEQLTTKTLSLLPVIKGEPVTGYIIEDINLEPKQVEVRGPESVLSTVDILWTEPIDVTELDQSTTVETMPALPHVTLSLVEPTTIEARLKIDQKIITRSFPEAKVEAINTDQDYRLNPGTVAVTVRGPLKTVNSLAVGKALHVRVDLADMAPGTHRAAVEVSTPPDVEAASVEPRVIEATIVENQAVEHHEQQ